MQQEINNAYIVRTKAVSGCFSMFMLMFGITFTPLFFTRSAQLMESGLLLPLMFVLEFFILVPLYYLFFRKRDGLGKGTLSAKWFVILFGAILIIQFLLPAMLGMRKTEAWVMTQVSLHNYAFWLTNLSLIFLVPVYEEIVFRGCLFNAFQYWFNDKVWATSLAVSTLFALMHTQYADIRTLLMLFLISQVLIVARVKSKGLLMPVTLHILMNATVIGIQYGVQVLLSSG
ncbi:CPBP family intramembrane glutamic endopeptidase [Citrobacter koseri]|uniref:CPBP family intramembrane glutamic endopeptidase n=1 Tax=Citrobacter koseri TaxID=545 RepID=UPI003CEDC630